MAAYTLRSTGTATQNNGPCTAGQPAGIVAGDLLLLNAVIRNNAYTLAPPLGWVKLSPNINDTYNYLFGRIATATAADNAPNLTWSGTAQAQAQMTAWFGDVFTDLFNIVHTSVDVNGPGAGPDGNSIQYSALNISAPACLVIARGVHNKTTTGNGVSVDALGGFTQISQQNPNGPVFSAYWGYQMQVGATNLGSVAQTRSGATVEALQQSSLLVALKTASALSAAGKAFIKNQQCSNNG